MLRPITTTVSSTLAALCLVSTLALAQSPYATPSQYPAQPMTPQYGNTTPQQGHRQHPAPSERPYDSQRQTTRVLCTRDDGKGNCTAATGVDGKEFVVHGEGLKSGAYMTCVDRGTMVDCDPAS